MPRRLVIVLIGMSLTLASCANGHDRGARGVRRALSREANRLALLSERTSTIELVPATDAYWVAMMPSGTKSIPAIPDAIEKSTWCGSDRSRSYVLVGDGLGAVSCAKTRRRIEVSTAAPQYVHKSKGEAVRFLLARDEQGRVHLSQR
jgi:hypothetical protein